MFVCSWTDAAKPSSYVGASTTFSLDSKPENPVLELNVIGYDIHQDVGRPYCSYVLKCRYAAKIWTIEKRFSEFFAFDQQLRHIVGRSGLLPPPLRRGLIHSTPAELDQRKRLLNDYIHTLSIFVTSHTIGIGSNWKQSDENAEKSYWDAVHAIYGFVRFVEFSPSVDRVHLIEVMHESHNINATLFNIEDVESLFNYTALCKLTSDLTHQRPRAAGEEAAR